MIELRDRVIDFAYAHKNSLVVWAVVLVSGFMVFKGLMQVPQIHQNKAEIASLTEQIKYEETRQRETRELMTQVNSDEYIEKIASEKLGLVKSNAKIFIDVSQEQ